MEVGQTKKAPVAAGAFFSSHIAEVLLVLFFGGVVYCALEVLWRGRTHISMAICGGVCFLIMYELQRTEKYSALPLVLRALFGALIITAAELITGSIVNLGLGLGKLLEKTLNHIVKLLILYIKLIFFFLLWQL